MNKLEMIQKFLDDASSDGVYFNNAQRVMIEIAVQLAQTDDRIQTYQPFDHLDYLSVDINHLPADVKLKIDEAFEAAHMHLTCQPGYHEALSERSERLRKQDESMRAYYEKHGTKGEF